MCIYKSNIYVLDYLIKEKFAKRSVVVFEVS